MQLGQKGKGAGKKKPRTGGRNPGATGPGLAGGVGQFPNTPPQSPAFLPNTPGYEQRWRGANDQLSQAEGAYAVGQEMIPSQYGLQKSRLDTDMGVATDRLKEDLAGRGVYTAKNAQGTYGGTSPAGGGIGQTAYTQKVATPFGRQYQDLADSAANAYNQMYQDYAGANLGYNMNQYDNYLQTADEAYNMAPMGLSSGGYNVPGMDSPYYPFAPQGRPTGGGKKKPSGNRNSPNKGHRRGR